MAAPDKGVDEAHGNAHDALQAQPHASNQPHGKKH